MSVQWSGSDKSAGNPSQKTEMALGVFFLASGLLAAFIVSNLDTGSWTTLAVVIVGGSIIAIGATVATYVWTKE